MALKSIFYVTVAIFLSVAPQIQAEDEACEESESQNPAPSSALLQVKRESTERACSWQLEAGQDGSQPCRQPGNADFTSGAVATLDEDGYQRVARLCCHHEMSLFVRRELQRQGFDICDLSDLHGFVHWYDCSVDKDDKKTYAEMVSEIAGVPSANCPWLARGGTANCPIKGPNCRDAAPCPEAFPANSLPGSSAPLTEAGYLAVASRKCHPEMVAFVRRAIDQQGFEICQEGAVQGFSHWFDSSDDRQTYAKLLEGLRMGRSGLPPLCPWLGSKGEACPPRGHNCPIVEVAEPAAHRRRTACR